MAWTKILDDDFVHADTAAGAAGSKTGVPTTPAVGAADEWTDVAGANASISSNRLQLVGGFNTVLLRPASEGGNPDQRVVFHAPAGGSTGPMEGVLRYASAGNYYICDYYPGGHQVTIFAMVGGSPGVLGQVDIAGHDPGHDYAFEFTAVGSSPTTLVATAYDLTALGLSALPDDTSGTANVATLTRTDSTAAMQASGLRFGVAGNGNPVYFARVRGYRLAATPTLSVAPPTATGVPGGAHVAITATLANSVASLTASVSGGGTLSTATPTSGVAFDWIPPSSGSGTATVTVADADDGLSETCVITYAPGVSLACVPTTFPLGVATPFTLTRSSGTWSGAKATVSGGTDAAVVNLANPTSTTLTGTLNPGSAAGTLTLGSDADAATTTVAAELDLDWVVVFHGDSLTDGFTGAGTIAATRLAAVFAGLGPRATGANHGHASHTLSNMLDELGWEVDATYDGTKAANLLVAQGGTNDIIGGGADAATVIARIEAYIAAALAAHPSRKIVWCTLTPASYLDYAPLFDATRAEVNAHLRANWRSMGLAALSDPASDARIGLDGREFDADLYLNDHTHPTDAGFLIWGQHDLAACLRALAGADGGLPPDGEIDDVTAQEIIDETIAGVLAAIPANGSSFTAIGDTRLANLNATISSRSSQASVDTIDDFLDTEVAAIAAKTVNLPANPAAVGSAMTLADGAIASAKFATITPGLSGFLERLAHLTGRFFPVAGGSVAAPKSGNGNLVIKGAGGTTISTQPVTDDGTTQTLGAAS